MLYSHIHLPHINNLLYLSFCIHSSTLCTQHHTVVGLQVQNYKPITISQERMENSSSHSKCAGLCFMILHNTVGHIPKHMRTASHCYQETKRKREPRAYLYLYTMNSFSLFGCFGKWRRAEKVSGLRSLSGIHQAWERDGRGGQKCSGFNSRATTLFPFSITHVHRHTYTHPGGTQHSMPPCIKVCVFVCRYTKWAPSGRSGSKEKANMEGEMQTRGKDESWGRGKIEYIEYKLSYSAQRKEGEEEI